VLPATVGVHVDGNEVFLGTRGEPAFLTGSYSTAQSKAETHSKASN
jgi:hypothetical protein